MKTLTRTFKNEEIQTLLDAGGNYRKFNQKRAEAWLKLMIDGRWVHPYPASIVLSANGKRLVDGQHRLWAALRYNQETRKSIQFLVAYVKDEEGVALTMDVGKPRTLADHLRHVGSKHTSIVASILGLEAKVRKIGQMNDLVFDGSAGVVLAVPDQAAIYEEDPTGLQEVAAATSSSCNRGRFKCDSLLGSVAWQLQKTDRRKLLSFLAQLGTGENLKLGDPIATLRASLQKKAIESSIRRRSQEQRCVTAAIIIKSWNAWLQGRELRQVGWTLGSKESFPLPVTK